MQDNTADERVRYYLRLCSFMNNNGNDSTVSGTDSPGPYQGPAQSLFVMHAIRTQNWAGITGLLEPRFNGGGGHVPEVNAFWLRSYITALIHTGDHYRAGELIEKYLSQDERPYALYLRALYHTHNQRFDEALAVLEKLLAQDPEYKNAKDLTTKLLLNRISKNIAASHIDAITADIDLLLRLHPEGLDTLAGASSLRNYLPVVYLKGGQRGECARIWEEELIQHPENFETLHSLAILYYWGAIDEENLLDEKNSTGSDTEPINTLWIKAIAYLVTLKYAQAFWDTWKEKRESACSRPGDSLTISDEEIRTLRNKPLERLQSELQNRVQEYNSKGWTHASDRIARYIILLDLEQISASKLNSVLTKYHDQITDLPSFGVCGNSMITFLKLRNDMDGLITLARSRFPFDSLIDDLAVLMSPLGYTHMLTQRNLLDRASEHYYSLPEQIRQSPDGRTTLGRIYIKKVDLDLHSEYPETAIDHLIEFSRTFPDTLLLNTMAEDISRKLFEKTNMLDSREKHQEAIRILEQFLKGLDETERQASGVSLSKVRKEVKEHLASLYTNSGWKPLQEKRFDAAETAFRKALEYNPAHQLAKERMSTLFNNRGVEMLNNNNRDGGIALLEKAQSYNDDVTLRKNLAQAYFGKAAEISNSSYPNPLKILDYLIKANKMDPSNEEIRKTVMLFQNQLRR
jgi:tetratricopeptide (TPR) repeat protein